MTKKLLGLALLALFCVGMASATTTATIQCTPGATVNSGGPGTTPGLTGSAVCPTFVIPAGQTLTAVDVYVQGDFSAATGTLNFTYNLTTSGGTGGSFATTAVTEQITGTNSSSNFLWVNTGGSCTNPTGLNLNDCTSHMSIVAPNTYPSVTVNATASWAAGSQGFLGLNGGEVFNVFENFTYSPTPPPPTPPATYQLTYIPNLPIGDSVVNITNGGASGAGDGYGTTAGVTGSLCANVYVFTPDEEIVSCCSCPVTPDGLVSLSAQRDLISNPLTRVTPSSIVIKLVGTLPVGGTCANSAAGIGTETVAEGLFAWGTKLHANTSAAAGTYEVTEKEFTGATLSPAEIARLAYTCGLVLNQGSGYGVCSSCRLGGLGAAKQ